MCLNRRKQILWIHIEYTESCVVHFSHFAIYTHTSCAYWHQFNRSVWAFLPLSLHTRRLSHSSYCVRILFGAYFINFSSNIYKSEPLSKGKGKLIDSNTSAVTDLPHIYIIPPRQLTFRFRYTRKNYSTNFTSVFCAFQWLFTGKAPQFSFAERYWEKTWHWGLLHWESVNQSTLIFFNHIIYFTLLKPWWPIVLGKKTTKSGTFSLKVIFLAKQLYELANGEAFPQLWKNSVKRLLFRANILTIVESKCWKI